MEADIVALKDIQEVYKEGFEITGDLNSTVSKTKVSEFFLDEDIVVKVIKKMGPFATLEIPGRANSRFIMPADKVLRKELPKAIDIYAPVLDAHFPNRWHKLGDTLYLYYPELEIKNSMGTVHTIYDMVVEVGCNLDRGNLTGLCGKRYSFSNAELAVGYVHSHLPAWDSTNEEGEDTDSLTFQSFCTGGGTPFSKLIDSVNKRNSAKEIDLFLTQLTEYLKWESLEGRPFISMKDIGNSDTADGYGCDAITRKECKTISKFILDILADNPDSSRVVGKYRWTYILDPSFDPTWFFENIEQPVISKFLGERPGVLLAWDKRTQRYVHDDIPGQTNELPLVSEWEMPMITALNIKPKLINLPILDKEPTIPRISIDTLEKIVRSVNEYLVNGILTPKDESRDFIAT